MQNRETSLGHPTSRRGLRGCAAASIGLCGAYQVGLGTYFIALRPPVLAEDLRFFGVGHDTLRAALPRLEPWLHLVFTVLGGQMAAVGVLVIGASVRLGHRNASRSELALLAVAGVLSVGTMAAVNFALGSDFRWLLILPAGLWLLGLVLALGGPPGPAWAEDRHAR